MKNKKILIGIITLLVIVAMAVILVLVISSNKGKEHIGGNNTGINNNVTSNNNSKNSYSLDDLKKDIKDLHITNYVDFQLGYSFQYPIIRDLLDKYINRDYSAAVYRSETNDSLNSAFGDKSIKIIRIDLIEDFNNKSQEEILELLKFRYLGNPDKINYQKEFNNNNIK